MLRTLVLLNVRFVKNDSQELTVYGDTSRLSMTAQFTNAIDASKYTRERTDWKRIKSRNAHQKLVIVPS